MRVASVPSSFASGHVPRRQRFVTLALVVLLHAALLVLLLWIAPVPMSREKGGRTTTVELIAAETPTPDRSRATELPETVTQEAQKTEPVASELTAEEAPVTPESSIWSQVIPLTRDQLAAADRAVRTPPRAPSDAGPSARTRVASRGATDDSTGPGSGPNGETLYNARWEREPTNAELNTYLPGRPRNGWGIIACRTIPGNRVEDCHEIGQSPGSGLAGAIRRAAWQFRIFPPRIGGRPMVGEWVRIRIDYRVTEVKDGSGTAGG
jgi:hypothetical protein